MISSNRVSGINRLLVFASRSRLQMGMSTPHVLLFAEDTLRQPFDVRSPSSSGQSSLPNWSISGINRLLVFASRSRLHICCEGAIGYASKWCPFDLDLFRWFWFAGTMINWSNQCHPINFIQRFVQSILIQSMYTLNRLFAEDAFVVSELFTSVRRCRPLRCRVRLSCLRRCRPFRCRLRPSRLRRCRPDNPSLIEDLLRTEIALTWWINFIVVVLCTASFGISSWMYLQHMDV